MRDVLLLLLHTLFKDASLDNYVKVDLNIKIIHSQKKKKKGHATIYINYIHYQN